MERVHLFMDLVFNHKHRPFQHPRALFLNSWLIVLLLEAYLKNTNSSLTRFLKCGGPFRTTFIYNLAYHSFVNAAGIHIKAFTSRGSGFNVWFHLN